MYAHTNKEPSGDSAGRVFHRLLSHEDAARAAKIASAQSATAAAAEKSAMAGNGREGSYDGTYFDGTAADDSSEEESVGTHRSEEDLRASTVAHTLFKERRSAEGSLGRPRNFKADSTNVLPSPLESSATWLANMTESHDSENQPRTSMNYRPPELDVKDPDWGAAVDSWSIGCVLAEMYAGKADLYAGTFSAEARLGSLAASSFELPGKEEEEGQFNSDLNREAEIAAAFARSPAFAEIGRGPLFRAENAFEHLAMVERVIGKLPERLYSVSCPLGCSAALMTS